MLFVQKKYGTWPPTGGETPPVGLVNAASLVPSAEEVTCVQTNVGPRAVQCAPWSVLVWSLMRKQGASITQRLSHVVVDHMPDVINVTATRRYIGGKAGWSCHQCQA